jgi:hypothetical protein
VTIATAFGPATVFHRLALGVECFDVLVERLVATQVLVGREIGDRVVGQRIDPTFPCLSLEASGAARFKLRHARPVPEAFVVRVDDPARRYVPRRFVVHTWPATALEETFPSPPVPVRSRLLRTWLWPGSAYPFPRGTTVVRGRVVRASGPARWARLAAIGPTGAVAGLAHADDRGEFVLVVVDAGQNPLLNEVDVDVSVVAPRLSTPVDPVDRCADLEAEDVPRSSAPPTASDLDNPVLRGVVVPPGYALNSNPPRRLTVPTGAELIVTPDIDFDPLP